MNPYLQHQLDIEMCATEVLASLVALASDSSPSENTHLLRSSIKRWLSEVPDILRDGENTVTASEALTKSRISCIKAAMTMLPSSGRSGNLVAMADSHFLRYYLPLLSKMHDAKMLFDTPIVLLELHGSATSLKSEFNLTPPTFPAPATPYSSLSLPGADDDGDVLNVRM